MTVLVRAGDRFCTRQPSRETLHAFAFGDHYDPGRTRFGPLVAFNEDRLEPGAGYDPHRHRDVEILTWVLDGVLLHDDSAGNGGVVTAGCIQALSAGAGVTHSERADPSRPAHLLQMWLATDAPGMPPAYAQRDVSSQLAGGGWVVLAGGQAADGPAVGIRQRAACLRVARLDEGASLHLPTAPLAYVHVCRGKARIEGCGVLVTGDAAMITSVEGQRFTALWPTEVLVWDLEGRPDGATASAPASIPRSGSPSHLQHVQRE